MKTICLIVVLLSVCVACTSNDFQNIELSTGRELRVKLAVTPKAQQFGLSGIDKMVGYDGMLFIRQKEGKVIFWMKGMQFPLDIIYFDADGRVAEIYKNELPCDYVCPRISSVSDRIKFVLELPAGKADEYQIQKGTFLK